MLVHLAARSYRNFDTLDIDVPTSGLAIIGENGHGKTNLLEAVAYLGLLRSFRGARDADVIRFGAPAFHVRATLAAPSAWHTVGVGFERSTKRKRATLDGVEQSRLTQALGAVPSVAFSPADVILVTGGPAERRHYLDVMLALSMPAYLHALQQYRGALLRRNAALKIAQRDAGGTRGTHAAQVSIWEPALAEHGGTIVAARYAFVRNHAERYARLCTDIGEREIASLAYAAVGSLGTERPRGARMDDARAAIVEPDLLNVTAQQEALRHSFEQQRAMELRRGVTLVGPHRDDLTLQLGGRDLRTFGSAGQQRSAAIALRLLELATLTTAIGHPPLLLLDDPFAELDLGRAGRVLALLEDAGAAQVLLAVPRVEDIPAAFTRLDRRQMRQGQLA